MTQQDPSERRSFDWAKYEREHQPGLWRCRACGVLNDFEGQEHVLNEELDAEEPDRKGSGRFAMLAEHKCAGCGFTIELQPMWFITPKGEEPMHLESGFTWEPYGAKGKPRP